MYGAERRGAETGGSLSQAARPISSSIRTDQTGRCDQAYSRPVDAYWDAIKR
jgi:hypothetical protein